MEVAGRQADNKMSLHNLAVCFTPCLMRSEKPSMSDLIYVSKGVFVVNLLFANFDEIFGDKTTRAKLLHKHYLNRKKTL